MKRRAVSFSLPLFHSFHIFTYTYQAKIIRVKNKFLSRKKDFVEWRSLRLVEILLGESVEMQVKF